VKKSAFWLVVCCACGSSQDENQAPPMSYISITAAAPASLVVVSAAAPESQVYDSAAAAGSALESTAAIPESTVTTEVTSILTDLKATQNDQGQTVVTLPDTVLFDFGQSTLKPEAQATLGQLAKVLQSYPHSMVQIHGHTDNVGSHQTNLTLSESRAWAVRTELVQRHEIAETRFSVKGWGETKQLVPNQFPDGKDDPEGRAKNRRVEVIFDQRVNEPAKK